MNRRRHISASRIRGGQTSIHARIHRLYDLCAWKEGDLDHMCQRQVTPDGAVHDFHCRRLMSYRQEIARLLARAAGPQSLRSNGDGCFWAWMMHDNDSFPMLPGSPTVCLLALGLATGYATEELLYLPGLADPVSRVVVEDIRIRNTVL